MKGYLLILQNVILVELIIVAVFAQSTNTTFDLLVTRSQASNIVTLRCRNVSSVLQEPQAVFFLNNSELSPANYPAFRNQESQSGAVTFQLKRQLEGMYSCGVGEVKSRPISLITYPTSDFGIRRKRNSYFAVTGDTAVLNCVVSPGALVHYYYVTWRNGSRPLFRQSVPSLRNSTFPDSIDPRYRLDSMNLSLIIEDVRMSDSIQDYHCDLQVVDPTGGSTYDYTVASSVNISLSVLSPPTIITKPQQDTVGQSENAFFRCTAKGYPLPTISWMHNGRIVTDSHRDYLVTLNSEGSRAVTSDLRIISASTYMTGDITCIASANPPDDSDITLASHNASTSLTVLGTFKKLDVLISKEGDVIFLLELPTVYDQSIHLFIEYTDAHNSSQSYNRTTEIGFVNSRSIQYVEYSSQVSYDRFRVKAGLVSGEMHMLGPLTTAPQVYDKDTATLCDSDIHQALVYGIPPAGFLFLICITLGIIICILVCIIARRKDTDTPKLVYHLVKNSGGQMASFAIMNPPAISQTTDFPTQRNSTDGDITNNSGTPFCHQQSENNGTLEEVDGGGGNPALQLRQQQSVISSNAVRYAHKGNPVYHLVKKSMKDAKFPERKYRKLKEELRSTCEKCTKKEQ